MLYQVYDEAYAEATKGHPRLTDAEEQELRERLAQLIMDAYVDGEIEPTVLKWIALAELARHGT
jgi:hypothetical protein